MLQRDHPMSQREHKVSLIGVSLEMEAVLDMSFTSSYNKQQMNVQQGSM